MKPHHWVKKDPIPGTGGVLHFGGVEYRVVRYTLPVRVVRFAAYLGTEHITEAASFPALLRKLERIQK